MKNFTKLKAFLLIVAVAVLSITFTNCKKDEPQKTPVTIQVKTEGLLINEMKSFNPDVWVYNYNPNSYTLTFAGSNGSNYTYTKSIQELQQGFEVSVMPDTYTITYTTIHTAITGNAPLDNVLDIVINETKAITTPTDLVLTAQNDDYMVVFESSLGNPVIWYYNPNNQTTNNLNFFNSPEPNNQTYKYMYWNEEGDITINYGGMQKTIENATKGNIYHIVSAINGTTTVNILPMNYNMIGW